MMRESGFLKRRFLRVLFRADAYAAGRIRGENAAAALFDGGWNLEYLTRKY
jgi:hypothetical protein